MFIKKSISVEIEVEPSVTGSTFFRYKTREESVFSRPIKPETLKKKYNDSLVCIPHKQAGILLSQGDLVLLSGTKKLKLWAETLLWGHQYVIINHTCDLDNKMKRIKNILLVEADPIFSVTREYLKEISKKAKTVELRKAITFRLKPWQWAGRTFTEGDYQYVFTELDNILKTLKEDDKLKGIIDTIKKMSNNGKLPRWNQSTEEVLLLLSELLIFKYSEITWEEVGKFDNLKSIILNNVDLYVKFLWRTFLGDESIWDYLFKENYKFCVFNKAVSPPELYMIDFHSIISVPRKDFIANIEAWKVTVLFEMECPYREAFSKKFWDLFSRVALP